MIRKIITEQLLEECPNCGAPRVTEEKICPYCGTVMTVRKIDTLYLSTVDKAELAEFLESGEYAGVLREKRRRKQVDIVSTVRPSVMLLAGPAGIEIGESITILGYGKDYVVAPRDAA